METAPILIIEDNESIRQLYTDALEAAGLMVLATGSGKEGIALALKERPAVILVDILMPEMDGHEVVKKIREDNWGRHARIIYLTNLTEPENVVKAFEQSPEEYIVKSHTDIKEIVNQVRLAMHQE